jgi:hypothetical protein
LQVHKRMVDQTVEFLATLMTREIPLMNNLQIGCEVKVGKNWADMQKVKKIAID